MIGIVAKKKTGKPDWNAIKAEYLKGGTSYRKLAEKFDVNPSTLEKRAKRESWADQMRQVSGKVAAELPEKVAEILLTEAEDRVREHLRLWNRLLTEAEARLNAPTEPVLDMFGKAVLDPDTKKPLRKPHVRDAKHLDAIANVLKKGIEGERTALGLAPPKPEEKPPEGNTTPIINITPPEGRTL